MNKREQEFIQTLAVMSFDKVKPIRDYVLSSATDWYADRPDVVKLAERYATARVSYLSLLPDFSSDYDRSLMVSCVTAFEILCVDDWWHEYCNAERVGA